MEPLDVIEKLSNTTKNKEKEQIIKKAWDSGCMEFFEGVKYAYDPLVKFGVADKSVKVFNVDEDDDEIEFTDTWEDFKSLLHNLTERKLTGNNAIDVIHKFAMRSPSKKWNSWYRPIILKDLRCGVSETTVNKVLKSVEKNDPAAKNYMTTKWEIQLATAVSSIDNLKGEYLLDAKLDGVRITAILNKENKSLILKSRPGHDKNHLYSIYNSLINVMNEIDHSIVLDGEISGLPFQKVQRLMNLKEANEDDIADIEKLEYHVFDIIPLSDFKKGESSLGCKDRHEMLVSFEPLFQQHCNKPNTEESNVLVLPKLHVNLDTKEGKNMYYGFEKYVKEAKLEGVMLKTVDGKWKKKRSKDWLKWKPFIEVTLKIVDMEEGTPDKKRVGMLGALVCEGVDVDPNDNNTEKQIKVNVSNGFTDAQLKEFWDNKEKYVGRLAEVRGDAIIKSEKRDDVWSLRFPVFKGFRSDDSGVKE